MGSSSALRDTTFDLEWRSVVRLDRRVTFGLLAVCLGLALMGFRLVIGAPIVLVGLTAVTVASRPLAVTAIIFAVPASTIGWDVELATIGGRVFDARLLLTFGVASLALLAFILDRPAIPRIAGILAILAAYSLVVGLLRSDGVLTWGPPVARWTTYATVLALGALAVATVPLRVLMASAAIGFGVPATLGILQFVIGDASFMNGAIRATGPGGRGPIGLAFAGDFVLVLATALVVARIGPRPALIGGASLGFLAVTMSATRLVSAIAWLAVAGLGIVERRWRLAVIVTLFFVASLFVRTDLVDRYISAIPGIEINPVSSATPGEDEPDQDSTAADPSLRFRFFIWNTILSHWRDEPILGIGPGMTARMVAAVSPAERTAPHNDYVGVLAELGLVGLILYVTVQLVVIYGLIRRWRRARDPSHKTLVAACLGLFLTVNVVAAINNPIYFFDVQVALWVLVGAALAAEAQPAGETRAPPKPSTASDTRAAAERSGENATSS